jgi:hypothetical protein
MTDSLGVPPGVEIVSPLHASTVAIATNALLILMRYLLGM